jgi:hypothetical protein
MQDNTDIFNERFPGMFMIWMLSVVFVNRSINFDKQCVQIFVFILSFKVWVHIIFEQLQ